MIGLGRCMGPWTMELLGINWNHQNRRLRGRAGARRLAARCCDGQGLVCYLIRAKVISGHDRIHPSWWRNIRDLLPWDYEINPFVLIRIPHVLHEMTQSHENSAIWCDIGLPPKYTYHAETKRLPNWNFQGVALNSNLISIHYHQETNPVKFQKEHEFIIKM